MDHQGALTLALALAAAGCQLSPDFGEVLVEVDTDTTVPNFMSRLRVNLFAVDTDGAWYESRDVGAPSPGDWPLSFSLYTDAHAGKTVRLRLRGYPERAVRDFHGERFAPPAPYVEPPSAHSLAELCAAPPLLAAEKSMTLRRAAQPITEIVAAGDCAPPTAAGSIAVRVSIAATASYRFEVIAADPDGAAGEPAGDTTLALRRSCADPASQIACNDDIDRAAGNFLSSLTLTLDPGDYTLITGGKLGSPADLTVRWARADRWSSPTPAHPGDGGVPADPRDVVQGGGATPDTEPLPNAAIDLMTDVRIDYGQRRSAHLLLRGECLGTQADLRGGLACVDTAAARTPVTTARLVDGIVRHTTSASGSWAAAQPLSCSTAPRPRSLSSDGQPLFDEELCVLGGAFTLGNLDTLGLGGPDAVPTQAAVVTPFLLEKFELPVARYRQALRDGFVSPDGTPTANDGPISDAPTDKNDPRLCTFSSAPLGRESQPLSCISWYAARALCAFFGAELPSSAEWEYAAVAANRVGPQATYPWGEGRPDCCEAAWGRGTLSIACVPTLGEGSCALGLGPVAVDAEPWASRDVAPSGVSALGGNLSEWVRDAAVGYASPCWWQRPLRGVGCEELEPTRTVSRGGDWALDAALLKSALAVGLPPADPSPLVGLRCARRGAP